jgi:hypothetical protein
MPTQYQKSCLADCVRKFFNFCSKHTPYSYVAKHFKKDGEPEPSWVAEVYVLFFALFVIIGLFSMKYISFFSCFIVGAAMFRLLDILVKIGIMIFKDSVPIESDTGPYIFLPTRNPERWVILNLINIFEIVMCYAVLYLNFGNYFREKIGDPITAIYQSILTFTTLGYGEITPKNTLSKIIVITQLGFFILIVLLIAPRIFSLLRTDRTNNSHD